MFCAVMLLCHPAAGMAGNAGIFRPARRFLTDCQTRPETIRARLCLCAVYSVCFAGTGGAAGAALRFGMDRTMMQMVISTTPT